MNDSEKIAVFENELKNIHQTLNRIEKAIENNYAGKWTESWVRVVGFTTFAGILLAIFGGVMKYLT